MNTLPIFQQFAKGATEQVIQGSRAVIYTRVSTKDQTENLSLETQRKACIEYATKHNYTIVEEFGGTYESATSDTERQEFSKMIAYVKKARLPISQIIVYSLDRFSRNEQAIWLSAQLRKLNIEVVSVTQPMDMTNPAGQMHQRLVMVFNQFENELRRQKTTAGVREMLLQGNWPTKPPLGYDSVKISGAKRRIVINERGRILCNAFIWKQEGLSDEAIRKRLATKGISLCHQRVAEILRNPFYCGLIAHRQLNGQVIQGNHEGIVSKELFLQVNGVLTKNTHGYSLKEENDHVPLKRFLRCDKCSVPLAGYLVKRKHIHYYKCQTLGCRTNRNANALHERFAEVLEWFTLDLPNEVLHLIRQQAVATFNQYSQSHINEQTVIEQKLKELQSKVQRLEERLMAEEIPSELYYKYVAKYNEEITAIEAEQSKASVKISNLDECVDLAIDFAVSMPKKWLSADYSIKQRLQQLLFPEGMYYNRGTDKYRTPRVNAVFLYLAYLKQVMKNKKGDIAGFTIPLLDYSVQVAGSRIELPTLGL